MTTSLGYPDPLIAGKEFVHLVAAHDPAACDLLTERAKEVMFFEGNGLGSSCEKVLAREEYADHFFPVSGRELAAGLDEAAVETEGSRATFRFCMPKERRVTIELNEDDSTWWVESVGVGASFRIDNAGTKHFHPCTPAPAES